MLACIALPMDTVAESMLRESFKLLENPGFSQEWRESILWQSESSISRRHFAWIAEVLSGLLVSSPNHFPFPLVALLGRNGRQDNLCVFRLRSGAG